MFYLIWGSRRVSHSKYVTVHFSPAEICFTHFFGSVLLNVYRTWPPSPVILWLIQGEQSLTGLCDDFGEMSYESDFNETHRKKFFFFFYIYILHVQELIKLSTHNNVGNLVNLTNINIWSKLDSRLVSAGIKCTLSQFCTFSP